MVFTYNTPIVCQRVYLPHSQEAAYQVGKWTVWLYEFRSLSFSKTVWLCVVDDFGSLVAVR